MIWKIIEKKVKELSVFWKCETVPFKVTANINEKNLTFVNNRREGRIM